MNFDKWIMILIYLILSAVITLLILAYLIAIVIAAPFIFGKFIMDGIENLDKTP